MGVKEDPTFTAITSKITNLVMQPLINLCKLTVNGITINNVTSFVRNVESRAENRIKKFAKFLSVRIFLNIFSDNRSKYPLSLIPVVTINKLVKTIIVCQSTRDGYFLILYGNKMENNINRKSREKRNNSFLMIEINNFFI